MNNKNMKINVEIKAVLGSGEFLSSEEVMAIVKREISQSEDVYSLLSISKKLVRESKQEFEELIEKYLDKEENQKKEAEER